MNKRVEEWLKQSDYDMETAKYMFEGGRYSYSVFMCHLSVEKLLKGLYENKLNELPAKTHNLVYILNQIGIKPDKDFGKIIIKLNEANIATRYPESLEKIQKDYTREIVQNILLESEGLLKWIRNQL